MTASGAPLQDRCWKCCRIPTTQDFLGHQFCLGFPLGLPSCNMFRLTVTLPLSCKGFKLSVALPQCHNGVRAAFGHVAQEFAGKWVVEPDPAVRDGRSLGATKLRYEISVVPKWPIPNSVVSHLVKAGLPANITAIAERAEEVQSFALLSDLQPALCMPHSLMQSPNLYSSSSSSSAMPSACTDCTCMW